jgi:hypothetical protein
VADNVVALLVEVDVFSPPLVTVCHQHMICGQSRSQVQELAASAKLDPFKGAVQLHEVPVNLWLRIRNRTAQDDPAVIGFRNSLIDEGDPFYQGFNFGLDGCLWVAYVIATKK